jgi:hypothetical protein
MKAAALVGMGALLACAGCAARPLDVPTAGLPLKCGAFTQAGTIFVNLTCSSKNPAEPEKRAQ